MSSTPNICECFVKPAREIRQFNRASEDAAYVTGETLHVTGGLR